MLQNITHFTSRWSNACCAQPGDSYRTTSITSCQKRMMVNVGSANMSTNSAAFQAGTTCSPCTRSIIHWSYKCNIVLIKLQENIKMMFWTQLGSILFIINRIPCLHWASCNCMPQAALEAPHCNEFQLNIAWAWETTLFAAARPFASFPPPAWRTQLLS